MDGKERKTTQQLQAERMKLYDEFIELKERINSAIEARDMRAKLQTLFEQFLTCKEQLFVKCQELSIAATTTERDKKSYETDLQRITTHAAECTTAVEQYVERLVPRFHRR
jgi:hypothetical protein